MAWPHPTQAYSVGWGLRFKNEGSLRVAIYFHGDCARAVGMGRGDAGARFHHIYLYRQTVDHLSDPPGYNSSYFNGDI
jgi:hypothetical protein